MKKFLNRICICVLMMILLCSILQTTASAAVSSVNGNQVKIGDTIKYSLYLSEVPNNIEGMQMYIYYNNNSLKIKTGSLKISDKADGNEEYEKDTVIVTYGYIPPNGVSFKEKKMIASVEFEVIGGGSSSITYAVEELYDIYENGPGQYVKNYTFTSDIEVNGKVVSKDLPPVVNWKSVNKLNGAFVMSDDGKGKLNKDNDKKETQVTQNANVSSDNSLSNTNGQLLQENESINSGQPLGSKALDLIAFTFILVFACSCILAFTAKIRKGL